MYWQRGWKWILIVLGLIPAVRIYFVQELLSLFLFFCLAFAILLLLVAFGLACLQLVELGIDFLHPKLRAPGMSMRPTVFKAFDRLLIVAPPRHPSVSLVPIANRAIRHDQSQSRTRANQVE